MSNQCKCKVLPYGAPRCLLGGGHSAKPTMRCRGDPHPYPPCLSAAGTPEEGQPRFQVCLCSPPQCWPFHTCPPLSCSLLAASWSCGQKVVSREESLPWSPGQVLPAESCLPASPAGPTLSVGSPPTATAVTGGNVMPQPS